MSLFKICDWWSAQCSDTSDNYDSDSILCYRFGINDDEKDYIIVGSHTGHLSIFYPNNNLSDQDRQIDENQNDREQIQIKGYRPNDLILEMKFESPIINLVAGKFTANSKNDRTNQLAILHPLCLSIYTMNKVDGVTEHGTHTVLQILVEYKFSRLAFSICKGHFGKIKGREFLCVNHMDGYITFYEQDGINYECSLPGDNSLPSNLYYISRTDSFIRMNSYWELESYSYQDLSQSTVLKTEITPTWSICIGEYAIDIIPVQATDTKTSIMILGQQNFICVTDEGKLQFILKLDYSPKCFYSFVVGWYWEPNARLITAIVSENSSLLIYHESKLIWVAQFDDNSIIAIKRSNLNDLPGGIVTLNSNGLINVGYLGSEPYIFKVPPLNLQELNYDKCHKELIELEKKIKKSIDFNDNHQIINDIAEKNLNIEFHLDTQNLIKCTFINDLSNELKNFLKNDDNKDYDDDDDNNDHVKMCCGKLKFTTKVQLEQIQIYIRLPDGIKCNKTLLTFNSLNVNHTEIIDMWFYPTEIINICTAKIDIIISFINKENVPKILTRTEYLPLPMFYKISSPQKDASIRLTLKSMNENKSESMKLHKLSSIFEEFEIADDNLSAIGFMMILTGHKVTVITAKNTNRYRIQSDSIEAIALILEAIMNYIQKINGINKNENFDITSKISNENLNKEKKKENKKRKHIQSKPIKTILLTPPTIPVKEIMKIVLEHHNIQKEIKNKTNLMNSLWNQFKLFQRSLRSKNEDDPVDGLMMLIEKNYDDLITEGDQLMSIRENEKKINANLSCAIALVHHLVSCFENLPALIEKMLLSTLTFPVEDWTEKSWEECVAPAFDLLNHYTVQSRNKSIPLDSQPSVSFTYFEFDRFKRHMTSVLDRICRITSDLKYDQYKQYQRKNQQQILAPFTKFDVSKNKDLFDNATVTIDADNDTAVVGTVITSPSIIEAKSFNNEAEKTMIIDSTEFLETSSSSEITSRGEKFENKINQKLLPENEFKGRMETNVNNVSVNDDDDVNDYREGVQGSSNETTIYDGNVDADGNNNDDDDDDDENEKLKLISNENDWLSTTNNIIPTAIGIVTLGQGAVSVTASTIRTKIQSSKTKTSDITHKNEYDADDHDDDDDDEV